LGFSGLCFVPPQRRNNSSFDETISRFSRKLPETAVGYQSDNEDGGQRRKIKPETVKMRTLSVILAFAFVLAGSSMAGSADQGVPGIGTFAYSGSPIAASVHHTLVVAAR
jgi:hypothetical protein